MSLIKRKRRYVIQYRKHGLTFTEKFSTVEAALRRIRAVRTNPNVDYVSSVGEL